MRSIRLESDIAGFVHGLQPKHAKQVCGKIFDLAKNVRPNDSENMKGYTHCFRVTSGEYRIIYTFTPDDVRVLEVGPRDGDDVYKSFDRKYKNLNFAA